MEVRIDARTIYQPLARRLGISAAKIAVALCRAGITAADHSLTVKEPLSPAQAKIAAGILNIPEVRLNRLYAVADVPLAEPGTIFYPDKKSSVSLYEPSVPVRVPYKVYGSWIFHFQDGRKETVSGGKNLSEEQMLLVRQHDRRTVCRTSDSADDEMGLDREGLSIEFTEGEGSSAPRIILPLANYLAQLSRQPGVVIEKGLLIGSFGWGCSSGGDDVDFVLIAQIDDSIEPEQLSCRWGHNSRLALRVNSPEEWRQAEMLRTEFLTVPENDYDAAGFDRFVAAYRGKHSNRVLTLAWYSDFIDVEQLVASENSEIAAQGRR